nr:hypothetical protein [Tanacetum cinerariifolium]
MEILLESTSNKLMLGVRDVLLMLEILSRKFFLKLNLPDHRISVHLCGWCCERVDGLYGVLEEYVDIEPLYGLVKVWTRNQQNLARDFPCNIECHGENFAQRSNFVYLDRFGLGEMSFYHTLDLISELDETTVGCSRDSIRHRDSLEWFSEVYWFFLTFFVIEGEVEFRRISLTGFRSCASRSQTGASQSRQSTKISIFTVSTYVSLRCSGNTTWIMRRTFEIRLTFHSV